MITITTYWIILGLLPRTGLAFRQLHRSCLGFRSDTLGQEALSVEGILDAHPSQLRSAGEDVHALVRTSSPTTERGGVALGGAAAGRYLVYKGSGTKRGVEPAAAQAMLDLLETKT